MEGLFSELIMSILFTSAICHWLMLFRVCSRMEDLEWDSRRLKKDCEPLKKSQSNDSPKVVEPKEAVMVNGFRLTEWVDENGNSHTSIRPVEEGER